MNASDTGPQSRTSWACHAGHVAFFVTGPSRHATAWQAYLVNYLPGPVDDLEAQLSLPTYRLDVFAGQVLLRGAVEEFRRSPVTGRIEAIDGVVLTETTAASGRRCYILDTDTLEGRPGAWAATIKGQHVELFCRTAGEAPRYTVRIMREVMLRTHENAGGVIFHAAGVDLGGAGVMICGAGAAGKTTTMTVLLRSAGGALLAGDRLIVYGTSPKAGLLVAVPLPVKAGRGTVEVFSELRRAARAAPLSRPQSASLDHLPTTFGSPVKAEFSAREYAAAFGASLSPSARLAAVVVPRFSDSAEPPRLRRLGREEAQAVLAANCFTPRDEFWAAPWLVRRDRPDAELAAHAERLCADIAARVKCVEVAFGVRNRIELLEDELAGFAGGIR